MRVIHIDISCTIFILIVSIIHHLDIHREQGYNDDVWYSSGSFP